MCSFVNDWNIFNKFTYNIKLLLEYLLVNIFYLFIYFKKYIPKEFKNNLLLKIITKISFEIFSVTLETYCL